MTSSNSFNLPDFDLLEKVLSSERNALVKVQGDDTDIREVGPASIVLKFACDVSSMLSAFFADYPSLIGIFEREFVSFKEFISRENILKLVFLDDRLFPPQELFYFGSNGLVDPELLDAHIKSFEQWIDTHKKQHQEASTLIEKNFNLELKPDELPCQCVACVGSYRNVIKEFILHQSMDLIEEAEKALEEDKDKELDSANSTFFFFRKQIDKNFHKIRYRLRRGAYANLDAQVKTLLKKKLTYPTPLAMKREEGILVYLKDYLIHEGYNDGLVEETEFRKFFSQLQINIWHNKSFILNEFKKVVRSLLVFKRKDISGRILQDYLGKFWQHSQARSIKRKIIYHRGPTNSGKTYHAIEALSQVKKGCYLAPLRLLAAELFDTMNAKGVITTLLTGEEVIEVEGATHYSSTIEMARLQENFDCCVIDEIQMITDSQRGWAWTRALVNIMADEVHICGDASVLELVTKIVELCKDELEIRDYQRMCDLKVAKRPIALSALERSDALVVFSRRNALRYKRDLEGLGFKVSIVYGRLSPEVRREQARKFDCEETDIIVSTDAIAMGMNLPIKRIVFSTLSKFIDAEEIPITESEIKQISGRAGRYQRFPTGYVSTLPKVENGLDKINRALYSTLEQQKKCMVGPDLDIFAQVSNALKDSNLKELKLSEFLRLFNTMSFKKPFYCVDLKEMIELAEMVEDADAKGNLTMNETFGFACAPVNLGLVEHIQYFVWILNNFVHARPIHHESIDHGSSNIDYLETSIKCTELYQWLARHFNNKNFSYVEEELLHNKAKTVERLNQLLGEKTVLTCSSCGVNLQENSKFSICESCFKKKRFGHRRRNNPRQRFKKSSSRPTAPKKKFKKTRRGASLAKPHQKKTHRKRHWR